MLFTDVVNRLMEYMKSIDRSPITIDKYKRDLTTLRRFLEKRMNGQVYIEDVTQDDLEAFMLYTKEVMNLAPETRGNYFYTIRVLYAFAYKKELVTRDIAVTMDFMRMPKKERVYLTEFEFEKMIKEIEIPLIKLMAIFLFNTGLRISECLNLKLDDVDFDTRIIHVVQGKGRKDRSVPINNKLYALLTDYEENWRDGYGTDYFFATRRTGKTSYPHVNSTIRNAAKKAGLKKTVSCHILRHSFASALVSRNVNPVQIQKLLGHESLAVTTIYTHSNMEDLSQAVKTLD